MSFLHAALLRFSKTVTGPLGRHSNYWAERIRFLFPKEKLLFSGRTKSGLLRGSSASSVSFLSNLECRREAEQLLPFALRRTFFRWPLRRLTVWQHVTLPNLRQFSLFRRPRRLRQSGKRQRPLSRQLLRRVLRVLLPRPPPHPTPPSIRWPPLLSEVSLQGLLAALLPLRWPPSLSSRLRS